MLNLSFRPSKALAALALSVCVFSSAAQANSSAERQLSLLPDYLAAYNGDGNALQRTIEAYSQWIEESPENPTAQSYYGGSLTLKGRESWMPWNKMKHTERGLDIMAKSVELMEAKPASTDADAAFERVDVLSMAGITFIEVPDMFGRFEEGHDLLIELVESEQLLALPITKTAHVYYFAGQAAEKMENVQQAIGYYQTLLERDGTGPNAEKAKQRLQALGVSE